MIGSHDTYTFENPILGIWNASKRLSSLRSIKDLVDLQTKDTLYFIDYCTNEYD